MDTLEGLCVEAIFSSLFQRNFELTNLDGRLLRLPVDTVTRDFALQLHFHASMFVYGVPTRVPPGPIQVYPGPIFLEPGRNCSAIQAARRNRSGRLQEEIVPKEPFTAQNHSFSKKIAFL